ncbi:MAG TPA: type I polyketide synthase, partial [Blastocatellia bacterium]|nr:type I polyketide synthase [Blastocatellia bacterium]
KFADAGADGFTRSDGVGVVVLKPLSQALADRDPIYAVIRGTAVNNDGRSSGLLATPSSEGQKAALRDAYRDAGISPGLVQYVEAHGTGTSVGDPIEVQSLGEVLAEGRPAGLPCLIGSIKTNIGHTEGAAGIAGLIKVALSIRHGAIPPSLHFNDPNPSIGWDRLPLQVSTALIPFERGPHPITAGVSAFGISATNAHVVLQEPPALADPNPLPQPSVPAAEVLTLSARSDQALTDLARAYLPFLAEADADLRGLCFSASVRRSHHEHRLALVARSKTELAETLESFLRGEYRANLHSGSKHRDSQRKIAFVFSGQGGQWSGMGRQLFEQEPAFRDAMTRCDEAFKAHVSWSLLEELHADQSRSRLYEIDVAQPFIFAVQVALAALWRRWGIEPDAVVGQSMGEVAAAHVAGALSLEEAAQVICRRSLLLKRLSGRGGMAVVGLSMQRAAQAIAGFEDLLSIAVSASPDSTVLSGDVDALDEVMRALQRQDIFCQAVRVDIASHSPQMDPLKTELLQALEGIKPRRASTPIYSTITGEAGGDILFDPAYWMRNLREPVLLSRAIQRLAEDGHSLFLEVSPHPILSSSIQQVLAHSGSEGRALPSMRKGEDEREVMLGSIGALYADGYPVNWGRVYSRPGRYVPLPAYPWQREQFWLGRQDAQQSGPLVEKRGGSSKTGRLLPGLFLRSASGPETYFWEFDLSTDSFPHLSDHRLQGEVVVPGAAYVEMVLAAASEVFCGGPISIEKLSFKKALFLPPGASRKVQLIISPDRGGKKRFEFLSLTGGDVKQAWTLQASGLIGEEGAGSGASLPEKREPARIKARCHRHLFGFEHYDSMSARGLEYGPCFRGVEYLWRGSGEAIGRMIGRGEAGSEAGQYQTDAVLIDSCFQVLAAAAPEAADESLQTATWLPVGIECLRIYKNPASGSWSHASFDSSASPYAETLTGDVCLLDDEGEVVLEARGLSIQRLERSGLPGQKQETADLLYAIEWQPTRRTESGAGQTPALPDRKGSWVIFADSTSVGQSLAESLSSTGEICLTVTPGDSFRELDSRNYQSALSDPQSYRELVNMVLAPGRPPCRGIVHLWSLEDLSSTETSLATLEATQLLGCKSVLLLVQALAMAERETSPRLWLVTGGAQAV